jgi:hypothetical protein
MENIPGYCQPKYKISNLIPGGRKSSLTLPQTSRLVARIQVADKQVAYNPNEYPG